MFLFYVYVCKITVVLNCRNSSGHPTINRFITHLHSSRMSWPIQWFMVDIVSPWETNYVICDFIPWSNLNDACHDTPTGEISKVSLVWLWGWIWSMMPMNRPLNSCNFHGLKYRLFFSLADHYFRSVFCSRPNLNLIDNKCPTCVCHPHLFDLQFFPLRPGLRFHTAWMISMKKNDLLQSAHGFSPQKLSHHFLWRCRRSSASFFEAGNLEGPRFHMEYKQFMQQLVGWCRGAQMDDEFPS